MKRRTFPVIVLTVIASLVLSACSFPFQKAAPTANTNKATATNAATTTSQVVAAATSTPAATSTSAAATDTSTPAPTATPQLPTSTAAPSSTSTPTPAATQAAASSACDAAEFVSDVSVPNLSIIASGLSFVKTWAVKNVGSCTWTTDYKLVFSGGYNMFGPQEVNLPQSVAPGDTANISIKLVVPSSSGIYQGEYKLADASGRVFGVGPNGTDPLVVRIQTAITPTPSLGYAVTNVTVSVDNSKVTAACPPGNTFNFTANITVNAKGSVTYHWIFSDGTVTGTEPLAFNAAGSHTVTASWNPGSKGAPSPNPYKGWAEVFIDIPNNAAIGQASIQLTCTK